MPARRLNRRANGVRRRAVRLRQDGREKGVSDRKGRADAPGAIEWRSSGKSGIPGSSGECLEPWCVVGPVPLRRWHQADSRSAHTSGRWRRPRMEGCRIPSRRSSNRPYRRRSTSDRTGLRGARTGVMTRNWQACPAEASRRLRDQSLFCNGEAGMRTAPRRCGPPIRPAILGQQSNQRLLVLPEQLNQSAGHCALRHREAQILAGNAQINKLAFEQVAQGVRSHR